MTKPIIKIDNGTIRQQNNTILSKINMEISEGDFIYIIGIVGSGKSTFLKMLYAELPLSIGTAEVAGYQLKRIKTSKIPMLRRKCGIVFQDFKLLTDRSVNDNLEFVLRATGWKNKKEIRDRIKEVLCDVGLEEKRRKMPHELSGGEQQRVVLARALLNSPQLIIADEPTGNIDPENSYRLIELLRDICRTGKTVLIATHQYDLISRYPGRVLRCENGEIHEDMTISRPQNPSLMTNEEMAAQKNTELKETVLQDKEEGTSENVKTAIEQPIENQENTIDLEKTEDTSLPQETQRIPESVDNIEVQSTENQENIEEQGNNQEILLPQENENKQSENLKTINNENPIL